MQELNLDLGFRYSDYSSVGGVNTYKADLDWRVFEPLRLRGGYNRSIRTPSVGELYAPVSTGSVGIGAPNANNTNGDPCDTRSSFRREARMGRRCARSAWRRASRTRSSTPISLARRRSSR